MKIIFCLFITSALFAAPSQYLVRKVQHPITIDGNLQDWSEGYYLDTIRGIENVFYPADWHPWDFNGRLYMAWDDVKVYFAVIVIHDEKRPPLTYSRVDMPFFRGGMRGSSSLVLRSLAMGMASVATRTDHMV